VTDRYGFPVTDTEAPSPPDRRWLDDVVARATRNVADGGGPFAAIVVRGDDVVAEGVNRVTRDLDPTAHAEVVAIRAACRALGTYELSGTVLVSSCEPCPLCLAASLWARVDGVVYAADRDDAAGGGFDDRAFYELFDRPRETWPVPVRQVAVAGATEPFQAWLANPDRVEY
jgi:tRNA(Arg) A34 adenosine deaminase TadA